LPNIEWWAAYIHGITASGLFTSVAFSESPEKSIGQGIFTKVGKDLVINLESREVGYSMRLA